MTETDTLEQIAADFSPGERVVVDDPRYGRNYATVVRPFAHEEPAFVCRMDGNFVNPERAVLAAWMRTPLGARDMVIGDLLNLTMLKDAIEKEFIGTLWVRGDSGPMTPYVCEASFGDGMHLLTISTINQRPNYHVVRVCSSWRESCGADQWDVIRDDTIGDHIDEILTAIEEECGEKYWVDEECAKCDGYPCHCKGGDPWPAIDANGGCSWGHIYWKWLMEEIGYSSMIDRLVLRAGLQGEKP